ncbi:MAG: hypothetical protein ACJA0H_002240, partial [Francisellaceae bacterium]
SLWRLRHVVPFIYSTGLPRTTRHRLRLSLSRSSGFEIIDTEDIFAQVLAGKLHLAFKPTIGGMDQERRKNIHEQIQSQTVAIRAVLALSKKSLEEKSAMDSIQMNYIHNNEEEQSSEERVDPQLRPLTSTQRFSSVSRPISAGSKPIRKPLPANTNPSDDEEKKR